MNVEHHVFAIVPRHVCARPHTSTAFIDRLNSKIIEILRTPEMQKIACGVVASNDRWPRYESALEIARRTFAD